MRGNNTIYLSLGSNIGNRFEFLQTAIIELKEIMIIIKISKIYETKAEEYEAQDDFLNMAIQAETPLTPKELLKSIKNIEKKMGRKKTIEKGPRNIDIDILFFNKEIISEQNLTIPHPAMQHRNFVLNPLMDLNPKLLHPLLNKTVEQIKKENRNNKKLKIWTNQKLKT